MSEQPALFDADERAGCLYAHLATSTAWRKGCRCHACTKWREDYNAMRRSPDYRAAANEHCRERYANDPDYRRRVLAWSSTNTKRRRVADPAFAARQRDNHRRHRYAIEPDEFAILKLAQDNRCFGCGQPPREGGRSKALHVDHDHETGAIRRLMCAGCNTHLGVLERYGIPYEEAIAMIRAAYNVTFPIAVRLHWRDGRIVGFGWYESLAS